MRISSKWMKAALSGSLLFGTILAGAVPTTAKGNNQNEGATTSQGFVSNADLDKHVIFQSFSLYQPYDSNMYKVLDKNSNLLKDWGISDVWMPPAYRAFSGSYYGEGYAIADRYDLGEFPEGLNGQRATKYGMSDELKKVINKLHAKGLSVQEDLVPNQMFGLPETEIVNVTSVDNYGNENDPNYKNRLVELYSKGGGIGQKTYGLIKEWNHTYYNGTGTQTLGSYRVMVDGQGKPYRYFGPDRADNYLPDWLANSEAQKYGKIKTVDNYLTVDSYFAVKGANTENDQVWRSLLLYYVDPQAGATTQSYLDYMSANGFEGSSDDEVREKIIAGDSETVTKLTDNYIKAQPGYSAATDPAGVMRFNKEDNSGFNKNVLQYEFLVGTDIDNSNPTVQAEQLNWAKFLMDEYGFDGFRVDAASHFNTKVLTDLKELMSSRYGSNLNNHLTYIESYTDNQVDFQNNQNNNGQLVYDHGLFGKLRISLGKVDSWRPLSEIVSASYVDRTNPNSQRTPNWSFVNNHDQEHNALEWIPVSEEEANGAKPHTLAYEAIQFQKYSSDRAKTDKQYAPYNVPSQYAYILTNKDTVPTVYYGDMFEANKSYMSAKTPYYDTIVKLLKARQQYVSGDQKITYYTSNTSGTAGWDLLANVRYGTSRDTGVATVIGNNQHTNTTINVDMGKQHANQTFVDATGFTKEDYTTDENGILTIPVVGVKNPLVNGYLGVWVPSDKKGGKKLDKGVNGTDAVNNMKATDKKDDKPTNGHEWQQEVESRQLRLKKQQP
ncbi:glycoside hydrolase family 70 protein [Paenibacillus caui]|uniref:glycoside hydrolase family 70 protein n=1 Tax=Paenibacillus caui TaxID=2873927 RepID=UPI001CA927FD|nr:glycoside hydrolase family 70 protein [Paenibacillus caui]